MGVAGLLDYPEFFFLWKSNKFDWLVWNVAFLFTIFLVRPAPRESILVCGGVVGWMRVLGSPSSSVVQRGGAGSSGTPPSFPPPIFLVGAAHCWGGSGGGWGGLWFQHGRGSSSQPPTEARRPTDASYMQGVEIGIIVSVCVSLLLVIYKTAFPRISTLGKLPGTEIYRWAGLLQALLGVGWVRKTIWG